MATGGDARTEVDFRYTCPLCMESYRGRQPKILPCFHTFCLPCLTALADSVTSSLATAKTDDGIDSKEPPERSSATDEKAVEGGGAQQGGEGCTREFLCPTCRRPVTVPEGGVASLQSNFYLECEDAASQKPLPCEMCEEGAEPGEATHACDACRKRMCRACRRFHDVFSGNFKGTHNVRPLGPQDQPVPVSPAKATARPNCQVHTDQPLCFRCQKCDVTICLLCKLTSHEGHVTEDLHTAAKRAQVELAGLVATANKQIQVVESSLDRLRRDKSELSRQEQEATQEVKARYDALITKATRARDEFLEDLSERKREAQNKIHTEMAASENTVTTLSDLLKRALRARFKRSESVVEDAEVLTLTNDLRSAFLSDDVFDKHQQTAARKENLIFFPCDADTSALDVETMRAYMGQLHSWDQNATTEPVVSVRQLADMVNSFQAEMKNMAADFERGKKMVSFYGRLTEDGEKTGNGAVLKFENIESNDGDAYDQSTGIFTAPVKGLYVFFLTVRKSPFGIGETPDVVVKVNDVESAHAYSRKGCSGSVQLIVQLDVGGSVWAEARGGRYEHYNTTFCGTLLKGLNP